MEFAKKSPLDLEVQRAADFFASPPHQSKAMFYEPRDVFFRRAKREGYRSRAAYKLMELNRRFHLIRPGDRVVDLGAAPGGWLQVASRLAGKGGRVIGLDIQPIEAFEEQNIFLVQGDIGSAEIRRKVAALLGARADCILSDLSPRLSGIRDADISRSMELSRSALRCACDLLKRGGNLLVKTFVGEELNPFSVELKERFRSVERTRPEATRKGSSEIYLAARGFRESQAQV